MDPDGFTHFCRNSCSRTSAPRGSVVTCGLPGTTAGGGRTEAELEEMFGGPEEGEEQKS